LHFHEKFCTAELVISVGAILPINRDFNSMNPSLHHCQHTSICQRHAKFSRSGDSICN